MSALARVAREMRHTLTHDLEQFSNGNSHYNCPSDKTNGYMAAKVPDWVLRQWLAAIEGADTEAAPPEPSDSERSRWPSATVEYVDWLEAQAWGPLA